MIIHKKRKINVYQIINKKDYRKKKFKKISQYQKQKKVKIKGSIKKYIIMENKNKLKKM